MAGFRARLGSGRRSIACRPGGSRTKRFDHSDPTPVRLTTGHRSEELRRSRVPGGAQDVHRPISHSVGRYRRMSLGVYPTVALADARRQARKVLGEVASNEDPAQVRQDAGGPIVRGVGRPLPREARAGEEEVVAAGSPDDRERASSEVAHLEGERDPPPRRAGTRRGDRGTAGADRGERIRALISKIFNFGISRRWSSSTPALNSSDRHRKDGGTECSRTQRSAGSGRR